jgi:hypothetical protein
VLTPDELRRLLDAVKGERFEDVFLSLRSGRLADWVRRWRYEDIERPTPPPLSPTPNGGPITWCIDRPVRLVANDIILRRLLVLSTQGHNKA